MYHDWDLHDKCVTGFTRDYLPLISNYSRELKTLQGYLRALFDMHNRTCKYLYSCIPCALENITKVIYGMCRGTQKSTSVSVNLDVNCTVKCIAPPFMQVTNSQLVHTK